MTYSLILVSIIAAILAQVIKAIINGFRDKFSWRDLVTYGGMPSSHAALVTSLALMAGLTDGWDSAAFAIALFLAILIIRDAGGYRMEMSKHAVELNKIISKMSANQPTNTAMPVETPFLKERIGHTAWELFYGCVVGVVVVVVMSVLI